MPSTECVLCLMVVTAPPTVPGPGTEHQVVWEGNLACAWGMAHPPACSLLSCWLAGPHCLTTTPAAMVCNQAYVRPKLQLKEGVLRVVLDASDVTSHPQCHLLAMQARGAMPKLVSSARDTAFYIELLAEQVCVCENGLGITGAI